MLPLVQYLVNGLQSHPQRIQEVDECLYGLAHIYSLNHGCRAVSVGRDDSKISAAEKQAVAQACEHASSHCARARLHEHA